MSPQQLRQQVILREGCSDNWTSVTAVYVCQRDKFQGDSGPGTERYEKLKEIVGRSPEPTAKKGQVYLLHDH